MKILQTEKIEDLICEHALILNCLVVGDDRPYYSVMLSPDKANLARKLREDDPQFSYNLDTYHGLNHIEIRSYFCDLLEMVNQQLTEKRIERFALLEFDVDKTREEILTEYKLVVESFYQDYIPGIG